MESTTLLTREQVERWVAERADVFRQHSELGVRLADLDKKLEAISFLLPQTMTEALLHPETTKPRSEWSFVELVREVLASSDRGFSPAEIRAVLHNDPEVGQKSRQSHNGVSNALARLSTKEEAVKFGPRYYLPSTLERIRSGEIEEQVANEDGTSFNAKMHVMMRAYEKPFTAAEAINVAKGNPDIAVSLEDQPSRVYSWLSRELYRKKLEKDGDQYRYPNENGALPSKPESAPDAGEGATSPNDSQTTLRLIG